MPDAWQHDVSSTTDGYKREKCEGGSNYRWKDSVVRDCRRLEASRDFSTHLVQTAVTLFGSNNP